MACKQRVHLCFNWNYHVHGPNVSAAVFISINAHPDVQMNTKRVHNQSQTLLNLILAYCFPAASQWKLDSKMGV